MDNINAQHKEQMIKQNVDFWQAMSYGTCFN